MKNPIFNGNGYTIPKRAKPTQTNGTDQQTPQNGKSTDKQRARCDARKSNQDNHTSSVTHEPTRKPTSPNHPTAAVPNPLDDIMDIMVPTVQHQPRPTEQPHSGPVISDKPAKKAQPKTVKPAQSDKPSSPQESTAHVERRHSAESAPLKHSSASETTPKHATKSKSTDERSKRPSKVQFNLDEASPHDGLSRNTTINNTSKRSNNSKTSSDEGSGRAAEVANAAPNISQSSQQRNSNHGTNPAVIDSKTARQSQKWPPTVQTDIVQSLSPENTSTREPDHLINNTQSSATVQSLTNSLPRTISAPQPTNFKSKDNNASNNQRNTFQQSTNNIAKQLLSKQFVYSDLSDADDNDSDVPHNFKTSENNNCSKISQARSTSDMDISDAGDNDNLSNGINNNNCSITKVSHANNNSVSSNHSDYERDNGNTSRTNKEMGHCSKTGYTNSKARNEHTSGETTFHKNVAHGAKRTMSQHFSPPETEHKRLKQSTSVPVTDAESKVITSIDNITVEQLKAIVNKFNPSSSDSNDADSDAYEQSQHPTDPRTSCKRQKPVENHRPQTYATLRLSNPSSNEPLSANNPQHHHHHHTSDETRQPETTDPRTSSSRQKSAENCESNSSERNRSATSRQNGNRQAASADQYMDFSQTKLCEAEMLLNLQAANNFETHRYYESLRGTRGRVRYRIVRTPRDNTRHVTNDATDSPQAKYSRVDEAENGIIHDGRGRDVAKASHRSEPVPTKAGSSSGSSSISETHSSPAATFQQHARTNVTPPRTFPPTPPSSETSTPTSTKTAPSVPTGPDTPPTTPEQMLSPTARSRQPSGHSKHSHVESHRTSNANGTQHSKITTTPTTTTKHTASEMSSVSQESSAAAKVQVGVKRSSSHFESQTSSKDKAGYHEVKKPGTSSSGNSQGGSKASTSRSKKHRSSKSSKHDPRASATAPSAGKTSSKNHAPRTALDHTSPLKRTSTESGNTHTKHPKQLDSGSKSSSAISTTKITSETTNASSSETMSKKTQPTSSQTNTNTEPPKPPLESSHSPNSNPKKIPASNHKTSPGPPMKHLETNENDSTLPTNNITSQPKTSSSGATAKTVMKTSPANTNPLTTSSPSSTNDTSSKRDNGLAKATKSSEAAKSSKAKNTAASGQMSTPAKSQPVTKQDTSSKLSSTVPTTNKKSSKVVSASDTKDNASSKNEASPMSKETAKTIEKTPAAKTKSPSSTKDARQETTPVKPKIKQPPQVDSTPAPKTLHATPPKEVMKPNGHNGASKDLESSSDTTPPSTTASTISLPKSRSGSDASNEQREESMPALKQAPEILTHQQSFSEAETTKKTVVSPVPPQIPSGGPESMPALSPEAESTEQPIAVTKPPHNTHNNNVILQPTVSVFEPSQSSETLSGSGTLPDSASEDRSSKPLSPSSVGNETDEPCARSPLHDVSLSELYAIEESIRAELQASPSLDYNGYDSDDTLPYTNEDRASEPDDISAPGSVETVDIDTLVPIITQVRSMTELPVNTLAAEVTVLETGCGLSCNPMETIMVTIPSLQSATAENQSPEEMVSTALVTVVETVSTTVSHFVHSTICADAVTVDNHSPEEMALTAVVTVANTAETMSTMVASVVETPIDEDSASVTSLEPITLPMVQDTGGVLNSTLSSNGAATSSDTAVAVPLTCPSANKDEAISAMEIDISSSTPAMSAATDHADAPMVAVVTDSELAEIHGLKFIDLQSPIGAMNRFGLKLVKSLIESRRSQEDYSANVTRAIEDSRETIRRLHAETKQKNQSAEPHQGPLLNVHETSSSNNNTTNDLQHQPKQEDCQQPYDDTTQQKEDDDDHDSQNKRSDQQRHHQQQSQQQQEQQSYQQPLEQPPSQHQMKHRATQQSQSRSKKIFAKLNQPLLNTYYNSGRFQTGSRSSAKQSRVFIPFLAYAEETLDSQSTLKSAEAGPPMNTLHKRRIDCSIANTQFQQRSNHSVTNSGIQVNMDQSVTR